MTKTELKKLIESVVRQELSKVLPVMVPQVIKEVMANLILESDVSAAMPSKVTIPNRNGNSHKRAALTEHRKPKMLDEDTDDGSWGNTKEEIVPPPRKEFGFPVNGTMIPMDSMVDDNGNVIPIRSSAMNEANLQMMEDMFSGKMAEKFKEISGKRVSNIDLDSPIG